MSFRVTPGQTIGSALRYSSQHNQRIARYQRELTTGIRLHKPSDDPAATERALALKLQDARFETDLSAISHVSNSLNQSVSQLLDANNILTRAKQIAIEATQPDAESVRGVHAAELDALLDRLLAAANASDGGRHLFGGTRSESPPFVRQEDTSAGGTTTVDYAGSRDRSNIPVARQRIFDVLYAGDEIFASTDRQPTIIEGSTGARPAAGTDSGIGEATLTVRHTATTYAPGSGIAAGSRSAAEDTIIGAAGTHQLTIVDTSGDGSAGTISLNGAPPVAFTNADTNLELRDASGGLVYVDTTGITAGFSGTVDITADGVLSIDGGATETPIDFSSLQLLTDSQTGRVTGIDSQAITVSGEDHVEYPGTFDVFGSLIALRDSLRNADGQTPAEVNDYATRRAEDFQRHADRILQVVGEQSTALETLESVKQRTEDLQLETRSTLGQIEGADLAEAAIGLQSEQQLLQMTFASLARVMDLSLLNFIQ